MRDKVFAQNSTNANLNERYIVHLYSPDAELAVAERAEASKRRRSGSAQITTSVGISQYKHLDQHLRQFNA